MCVTWKIAPMGQENETPRCNRIGGGRRGVGRPCKKPKPKKVLQRGLGVALLEKIRLEEEQREKEAAAAMASSTKSPYDMHLQFLNFHHSLQPPPNSLPSSTVSLANSGGSDAGWHGAPVLGNVSGSHLWGPRDFELEKKNFGMDPELAFASSLPSDSNPIRHLSNWVQRTQEDPSSLMMNFSTGTSSTTVPHSSTEPPSNQKYGGNYVSKRQEEKKSCHNRPNPFSLDTSPVSSSKFKPLTFADPMKSSKTISCGSGRGCNLDFGNSTLREIPSLSASNSQLNSKKNKKRNKNLVGDFLSLAPPTQCSCSKLKSPSAFLPFRRQVYPDFESVSYQGNMKNQVPPSSGYNQFNQKQQHWYNFIPPSAKVARIGQQSDRFQNCNVVGQSIDLDLSLKL